MRNLFVFIFLLVNVNWALGATSPFCEKDLESLPVLHGGRVKPLMALARESFRTMTGKEKLGEEDPVVSFCQLSIEGLGGEVQVDVPIKIEHMKAKQFFGLKESEGSLEARKLLLFEDRLRKEWMSQKENDAYKKELNKVMVRLQVYQSITSGQEWTFYAPQAATKWEPLATFLTEDKIVALKSQVSNPFLSLFLQAKLQYIKDQGDKYLTEIVLIKSKPFSWSMVLVLCSLTCAVLFQGVWPLFFSLIPTIGLQFFGIALRVYISGRAPITNMYETVMFSGLGALLIGVIISIYRKEKFFIVGGLGYNFLCLLMLNFANGMLDPAISPLVPVLRDNFWLSTHVTTIILSYAALALSWMLANIVLVKGMKGKISPQEFKEKTDLVYSCLKYGVVLLSAGIILGGVWADYSWGRFWGWDPKETWSLIVLLVYMAILHGRYTNWMNDKRFIPMVAGAFMAVMMAWFGVNYILASGLHSYGFSEGGALFLASFFAIQIGILIVSFLVNKKRI